MSSQARAKPRLALNSSARETVKTQSEMPRGFEVILKAALRWLWLSQEESEASRAFWNTSRCTPRRAAVRPAVPVPEVGPSPNETRAGSALVIAPAELRRGSESDRQRGIPHAPEGVVESRRSRCSLRSPTDG